MTARLRRLALVAVLAALVAAVSAGTAVASGTRPLPRAQRTAITGLVSRVMTASGYPGIALGVWEPGRTFVRAFGVADVAASSPLRARDTFRVGSVTKTLVATLALQLVEHHRLRLGEHLSRFYPRFPHARAITIRELLDHTSGTADYQDTRSFQRLLLADPERTWAPAALVRRATRLRPYSAPGRVYHYSNTNYLLLARIVERITGRPLGALLRRRVLGPLGMRRTTYDVARGVPAPAAHGYYRLPGASALSDVTAWNDSWADGAGAVTSTLADLGRWAPALAGGTLLDRRVQRQRLRFVAIPGSPGWGYGLGIARFDTFLGHNGVVPGYDALVVHDPRTRTTIVALGNTSPEDEQAPAGSGPIGITDLGAAVAAILDPPRTRILASRVPAPGGVARVPVGCPADGMAGCSGTLTLARNGETIGTATLATPNRRHRRARVRLTAAAAAQLSQAGTLRARAVAQTVVATSSTPAVTRRAVVLVAPAGR